MHRRIAREIARNEVKYPNPLSEDFIYDLIKILNTLFRRAADDRYRETLPNSLFIQLFCNRK